MTGYNKAVSYKPPEIIEKLSNRWHLKTLNDEEFLIEIQKKLSEEIKEYQDNNEVTELADILEVVYRIAELKGISSEKLEVIRAKKSEERGGFEKNLFQIS